MAFETRDVEPVGTREAEVLSCRSIPPCCRTEVFAQDVYPPSPQGEALRQRRQALALSLRQAAEQLALPERVLNDLEHGRKVFRVDDDWARAIALLARSTP